MPNRSPATFAVALLLLAAACGGTESDPIPPYDPYAGAPPLGAPIDPEIEATAILDSGGADTGWTWVDFPASICNDATLVGSGSTQHYEFSTSPTGLAIKWGTGTELLVFLQGGGACWDFVTCGGLVSLGFPLTASTGPFGPDEFRTTVLEAFPHAWLQPANLPAELANATIVFVPYCTGDIHGGSRETTYAKPPELAAFPVPAVTWNHAGHANLMEFLARLGPTFPAPSRLVVAGSSAGGFGALANYPAFRWYWPDAQGYLIDDSGPPLIGEAIPTKTRSAWYASWDLGVSLDAFCTGCRSDMSQGITELATRFPEDRLALVSHLEDWTIRQFFGTMSYTYPYFTEMSAPAFEGALRALGDQVMDPATDNAKFFFTATQYPDDHPALDDPTVVTTPDPGLVEWLARMVSDDAAWVSVEDP